MRLPRSSIGDRSHHHRIAFTSADNSELNDRKWGNTMKGRNGSALVVLAALVALVLVFAFILSSRSLRQAQLAAAPVSTVAEGSAMSPLVSPLNTPSFDPR